MFYCLNPLFYCVLAGAQLLGWSLGVLTPALLAKSVFFGEKNKIYMLFHIKYLDSSKENSPEIHEICHTFHAGKAILGSLRYLIPLKSLKSWQKLKVPSFDSEPLPSNNSSCAPFWIRQKYVKMVEI